MIDPGFLFTPSDTFLLGRTVMEFGEAIKNPAYCIPQTEYSGCLDISAHAWRRAGSSDLLL